MKEELKDIQQKFESQTEEIIRSYKNQCQNGVIVCHSFAQ